MLVHRYLYFLEVVGGCRGKKGVRLSNSPNYIKKKLKNKIKKKSFFLQRFTLFYPFYYPYYPLINYIYYIYILYDIEEVIKREKKKKRGWGGIFLGRTTYPPCPPTNYKKLQAIKILNEGRHLKERENEKPLCSPLLLKHF